MITVPTDAELVTLVDDHWTLSRPVTLTRPPQGTNNLTRIVGHDHPRAVLRVYGNLTGGQVAAEHRLLTRPTEAKLPYATPVPLPTVTGATFVSTEWGPVALFDWIEGVRPNLTSEPLSPRQSSGQLLHAGSALRLAGRALGQLDQALARVAYVDAPWDWLSPDLDRVLIDLELIKELRQAGLPNDGADWLTSHAMPPVRPDSLPAQIIHTDYAAGNLLFDADHRAVVAVLDFEVAGRDLRAMELAVALNQCGALDGPQWRDRVAEFTAGYAEVIALSEAEVLIIPQLIMDRAIGSVAWRAGRWRTGSATLSEVSGRVDVARTISGWLDRHAAELVGVIAKAAAEGH